MDNSIQATSCKASAENFFRAEIYRICHRQLLPYAWRFNPRSAMGADRSEVTAGIPAKGSALQKARRDLHNLLWQMGPASRSR